MLAKDLKVGEYGLIINSNCGHDGFIVKVIISNKSEVLTAINRTNSTWGHFKETSIEVEKLENVKITYDGCPETKSEYPKMMLVSNDNSSYTERFLYGKFKNGYLAQHSASSAGASFYKFAKEIETEELVHLTLEDISNGKGVGVNPELIRIKK